MAENKDPNQVEIDAQHEEDSPLSPKAIAAREQLRAVINSLEEAERARRVAEDTSQSPNKQRVELINRLVTVQEDLIRCINLKKVKEAEELERGQRITTEKKHDVHEELLRKAAQKEVLKEEEKERARRIQEVDAEGPKTDEQKDRMKTYDKLVHVQEDLLRHVRKMQADIAIKQELQISKTENNKTAVQEELLHQVHRQQASKASQKEQERQIEHLEHLSEQEVEQRVSIAKKLLEVQKELLKTHQPTKANPDLLLSDQVLEDYKMYMQEQLVRKAHQKEAIEAMEEERKRRIAEEGDKSPTVPMSDSQAAVLEEVARKASSKEAKQMFEDTQREYVLADQKAKAQEEALRHVNQKKADKAMDAEQKERIASMEGKPHPTISPSLKEAIEK